MFQIGRAPKVSKYARRSSKKKSKKTTKHTTSSVDENECYDVLFTLKPKQWLILPETSLSFFERSILRLDETDTFISPYLQSLSFKTTYNEGSLAYIVAKAAFPTRLSYTEIDKAVATVYEKNMSVRHAMKILMNRWKTKKMKMVNDVDLVSLESPVKPVVIIDWATKTKYQFEASTILRDSLGRLMNHDVMILESLWPRNPFTNSDLTYGNCLSIHQQLRKAGVTNWLWEAFAESEFDIHILLKTFEVPMKLKCLDIVLKDYSNSYTIEFIMDYILGEYEYHKMTQQPSEQLMTNILIKRWNNPTIQLWVNLCRTFWRAHIRNIQNEIIYTHIKSKELIHKIKIIIISHNNSSI